MSFFTTHTCCTCMCCNMRIHAYIHTAYIYPCRNNSARKRRRCMRSAAAAQRRVVCARDACWRGGGAGGGRRRKGREEAEAWHEYRFNRKPFVRGRPEQQQLDGLDHLPPQALSFSFPFVAFIHFTTVFQYLISPSPLPPISPPPHHFHRKQRQCSGPTLPHPRMLNCFAHKSQTQRLKRVDSADDEMQVGACCDVECLGDLDGDPHAQRSLQSSACFECARRGH